MNDYREPWAIRDGLIFSRDGHAAEAIAAQNPVCERLIACLNALAGIPTEEIQRVVALGKESQAQERRFMSDLAHICNMDGKSGKGMRWNVGYPIPPAEGDTRT